MHPRGRLPSAGLWCWAESSRMGQWDLSRKPAVGETPSVHFSRKMHTG